MIIKLNINRTRYLPQHFANENATFIGLNRSSTAYCNNKFVFNQESNLTVVAPI